MISSMKLTPFIHRHEVNIDFRLLKAIGYNHFINEALYPTTSLVILADFCGLSNHLINEMFDQVWARLTML